MEHAGETSNIDLTENDLLFITNGGCVESCTVGAQNKATGFDPTIQPGNGWDLWKKIAAQDPSFGHPEKFCSERPLQRPHCHRRHRYRQGLQLAAQLDAEPSAAVQGSAQEPAVRLGVRPVQR